MDQVLEYLKMAIGPGGVVVGVLIVRGIGKLAPLMLELLVEMRSLQKDIAEVKKYGSRLDKVEGDTDIYFAKTRALEKKLT